jgi:DNA-directed RNA polymerase subunit beta'
MESTFDYESQFEQVKADIAKALTKTLDVQADKTGLRLQARDVRVEDTGQSGDWESQREAVRKDKTWGVPVYATIDLTDRKTGKVISTAKRVKLATLPKPTDFGSFIVEGKHYQVQNQLRRKPGIFVIEKENGEPKTEINIAGRPFNIELDSNNVFKLSLKQGDSKQSVPLYPVLSQLGISDGMLSKAWGEKIFSSNKALKPKAAAQAVTKAAAYFSATGEEFDSIDDATKSIAGYLEETELRPEVTQQTVGKAFHKVTPEAILLGSKELLRTIAGERAPNDGQSLGYKKVFSLSDILRERFIKPDGSLQEPMTNLRRKIGRKLDNQRNPPTDVSQIIGPNQFTPAINSFFTRTELSSTTNQTNPIEMLNGMSKITLLGEGGAGNPENVRDDERSVHPSQMGFIDPIHTPDSDKIGLVMDLPIGATKKGDELQTAVYDVRAKKIRRISPSEASSMTVAFPDQYDGDKPREKQVKALVNGEIQMVDPKDVDVVLRTSRQAFSVASNMIPFLGATAGVRASAATKMLEQALPLLHREAPHVQVKVGNQTIESAIGSGFSIRALDDGTVKSVSKHRIVIGTKDGEVEQPIYSNLPLNNRSFIDATPIVKVGDAVKKDDVIADSNFTRNGTLAIGVNLRTAYIPWKGLNFEDGVVITESAAKKLTSEHMHQFVITPGKGTTLGTAKFMAAKPGEIDLERQGKLDTDGVVKKGAILKGGDPLWVGVKEPRFDDPDAVAMRRLGGNWTKKGFMEPWSEDNDGEVVDVVRMGKKVKIYVKTKDPAQIGDKLTGRAGGKGIITKIIPDGQAPHTEDGEPVDIMLSPFGLPTRMNPSQILETAASKLATMDGDKLIKPYVVDNSINSSDNYAQAVTDQLAKAGISDTEPLFDAQSRAPLGNVLVGKQYFLKLDKQAAKGFSARTVGKYDVHGNPIAGGDDGAKALDLLSMYAMLSHGSRANLAEMATYKASQNQPFWDWLKAGAATGMVKPAPEPTFAYKKFEAYLKGAGVNVKRNGSKMVLQPMTDVETSRLSSGAIKEPIFLKGKNLEPEAGGLMDPIIFGPKPGTRWGHIELAEPVPNPIFETPIKTLTGLKPAQYTGLVNGKLWYHPDTGEISPDTDKDPATVTGGTAIKALLSKIDVDADLATWTDAAKTAKTTAKLDEANKRLKYLAALKKLKVRPEDAYVQTKIPIMPPQFRPINEMEDGSLSNPGLNTLYRDVGLINQELKWQNEQDFIPDSVSAEPRQNLYNGIKALAGRGDPIAFYPEARRPQGIVEQLKGKQAKTGFFQYQVLRRRQDLVGRGTIIPEPKLGLDEVGLPEEMSWKLFEPFLVRRLVTRGLTPQEADQAVQDRTLQAQQALHQEMGERPVILNRAPSLHKFSIMSFKPQMVSGRAIKIPPLVVKGFGADFDGDQMNVHVPLLPDAVKEAQNMLPSNNLYNPGTGALMIQPQNEAALGLYLLSRDPSKKQQFLSQLPPDLQKKYENVELGRVGLKDLMTDLATTMPRDYGKVVSGLKQTGDDHAYQSGFSLGLKDLLPNLPEKKKIFADVKHLLAGFKTDTPEGKAKAVAAIAAADKDLTQTLGNRLAEQGNNINLMVMSGARGNLNQIKQIVQAPFMVDDHHGNQQAVPIMRSFAEGLPLSDYWSTLYGARAAATDKQLQTSEPGAFNKDIMATAVTNVISMDDCGTTHGIDLPLKGGNADLDGRYLASDIRIGNTVLAAHNDLVSSSLLNTLRDRKNITTVRVRSPLTCEAPKGTCAKCFGLTEKGVLPTIGDNIGAIAGQAMSEPLTQMTMRTFHTGGISGTRGVVSGYRKIDALLQMQQIKKGKATLARRDGKVTKIEDSDSGSGKNVYIGDDAKPHFVERDLWDEGNTKIRVGSNVDKGDILSGGLVQPQELVKLKGMLNAQDYISGEIQSAFHGQGVPIKRKLVETVIRSVGNTTKVGKDPGDSGFLPGDVVPWTVAEAYNNTPIGELAVVDAVGHKLLEDIPGTTHGEIITDHVKSVLQRLGKSKVTVGPKAIDHEPYLAGLKRVPLLRDDWMAQMGYNHIADAMVGGAAVGATTDIHDYSPVPAFAYGAEFGQAPNNASKKKGVY